MSSNKNKIIYEPGKLIILLFGPIPSTIIYGQQLEVYRVIKPITRAVWKEARATFAIYNNRRLEDDIPRSRILEELNSMKYVEYVNNCEVVFQDYYCYTFNRALNQALKQNLNDNITIIC